MKESLIKVFAVHYKKRQTIKTSRCSGNYINPQQNNVDNSPQRGSGDYHYFYHFHSGKPTLAQFTHCCREEIKNFFFRNLVSFEENAKNITFMHNFTGGAIAPLGYATERDWAVFRGKPLCHAPPFRLCLLVKQNKINSVEWLKYTRLFWWFL